ncbi:Integrator complex subunit 5 [Phytophthora infestans]|uniref:Integrator complex subunit 5 n=1 Tax=Phytophthora infestans TaxID=4787 RepID=A0A833VWZ7_PHYIN|nr:Integrator complex subunit 5 [Phytophthora infestans]KAF4147219.1 Integrator complex subunit 5 C-terminus [Phytophthora infestans]
MEIQLNAEPEDAPDAPSSASHAVSMSSLLSHDVVSPRDAVSSPPGLSDLMNTADDVQSPVSETHPVKLPSLETPELQTLQTQLHAALEKLWSETGPVSKRQKKSKQSRRAKAAADHSADVYNSLDQLQRIINTQFARRSVLEEVVKFSLSFCELLDEKESVQGLVVLGHEKKTVDLDETLAKLPSKPLYAQLVGAIRRAVLSAGDLIGRELLTQVLDWSLTRSTPQYWTWVMASIAQMNSYFVQEFLLREAIARHEDMTEFISVLEFLATKYPAQTTDILRDVLERCVSSDRGGALETVQRLVAIASDSAVLVQVCDENLQWIVTEELVTALASKFGDAEASGNGAASRHEGLEALLLEFIRRRSAELSNSGFQLLLLLQKLSTAQLSPRFAASVASFQHHLVDFAGSETSCAFVRGIYRFLPFICQNTLRLLRAMHPDEDDDDVSMTGEPEMSKETASQRFGEWKQWLCVLAQSISRKEVTEQLIKAELMLAEFDEVPLVYPLSAIPDADRSLCELLTSLLTPASPEYVAFMRSIVQESQSAAPRARRRILGVIQTLLSLNDTEDVTENELPVNLTGEEEGGSCMQQLAAAPSWSARLDSFELWKGVRGVEFWESFLDLARSKDSLVATRALFLVSRTPFLSLEDPHWQYRCIYKLSSVYFSLLRQFRTDLVRQGDKDSSELTIPEDCALQSRLHTLKMVLFRILALDGGVAHYASSVYSIFASLWLDALLSTTSATSIPTHFPNGVNFGDARDGDVLDERQIIRSERTISSKCTNLQSSQVITKVPEAKLVYRKTLDSSWEREMHAARLCSVYATEIFSQLVESTGTAASLLGDAAKTTSNTEEDEQLERRLKVLVDMLLERVLPCCGIPSDDVYKDMLPNRSSFDVDLRVEQWLNHFPAFLPLLRTVISTSTVLGSSQVLRLVPVFKSVLVVLLGHWNSVKGELSVENVNVPPYMRNRNQLALTCELMRLLRATNWLPAPLAKTAELLPLTTPADIRSILFSCWFYLSDHPPRSGSRAPTPATSATASPISSGSSPAGFGITGLSTGGSSSSSSNPPLEFYLIPLRKALHRNIRKIGAKYPLFMC